MNSIGNLSTSLLARSVEILNNKTSLVLLIILFSIVLFVIFFLIYVLLQKNYLTNTEDFFKRRLKEMTKDGMISEGDTMLVPVIHGKSTILSLEDGELLFFYQVCRYYFFRITGKVRNVNIDLLFSDKDSINDFENIGKGRIFFTSKMLIFENVRSRNKILWSEITEIKVKFNQLILFDNEGCHAFDVENAEILSNFIYNLFLKEV